MTLRKATKIMMANNINADIYFTVNLLFVHVHNFHTRSLQTYKLHTFSLLHTSLLIVAYKISVPLII